MSATKSRVSWPIAEEYEAVGAAVMNADRKIVEPPSKDADGDA